MHLYFIIPVMDERGTVSELTDGILANTSDHERSILFINDGSTDGTGAVLDELAAKHPEVEVVHFEQNRGKSAALAVAFERAEGDVVITMDGDLQDDPAEIPRYLEQIEAGYDLVCGWKFVRHDPWHKTLPSKVYNGFVGLLFGLKLHDINCGFKAMRLDVAKSLKLKHDYHRVIPVLAKLNGFSITEIQVQHHARRYGHSKYGLARFWHGLRDVFRVWRDHRMNRR